MKNLGAKIRWTVWISALLFACWIYFEGQKFGRFYSKHSRGHAIINTLYDHPPQDVPKKHWDAIVDALQTAHANLIFAEDDISHPDHERLLHQMLHVVETNPPEPAVDKLWELYERQFPDKQDYISRFKLTVDNFQQSDGRPPATAPEPLNAGATEE